MRRLVLRSGRRGEGTCPRQRRHIKSEERRDLIVGYRHVCKLTHLCAHTHPDPSASQVSISRLTRCSAAALWRRFCGVARHQRKAPAARRGAASRLRAAPKPLLPSLLPRTAPCRGFSTTRARRQQRRSPAERQQQRRRYRHWDPKLRRIGLGRASSGGRAGNLERCRRFRPSAASQHIFSYRAASPGPHRAD